MSPRIGFQPIEVMTGHDDQDGRLVSADGQLVAILVRLDSEVHGDARGGWFLEAGFGPCSVVNPPVFADLAEAESWIARQLRDARL